MNKIYKKILIKIFFLIFMIIMCFSDMYLRNCRLIVLLKFDVGDKFINIVIKE